MANEAFLTVRQLSKRFGEEEVLTEIDFDVNRGEVVVVLGPSGCGKSTLLRLINGLETADGGEIKLAGESVCANHKSITQIRQRIGMVFQSYELFPHKTILQNIMLAPMIVQHRDRGQVKAEAIELLNRVGLSDKLNAYPRQLSGGQKQRAAIIRAMCMHPEILLFDEVTAALDPEMVREVLDVVLELAQQGITMIIVTHEMQFARAIADRILLIDHGKIVEESEPEQFFTNPKTLRAKEFLQTFSFDKKRVPTC